MQGHTLLTAPICLVAITALAVACRSTGDGSARKESQVRGYEVSWVGELQTVHRDGDARPRADLLQLEARPGTFAIGPLAGLRGEITVVDGNAYIARAEKDGERVERGFDHEAPFLVFGSVAAWQAVPLPDGVRDVDGLEDWLPTAAAAVGLRADEPFPFKVETSNSTVDYHVISNTDPGYQVTRPHRELMRFFTLDAKRVTMLGVYSETHAGVFTHHGQATHIHMVSGDGLRSGHVDALRLGPDAVVSLPVP